MTMREHQGEHVSAVAFGKLLRRAAADMAPPQWEKYGLDRLLRSVSGLRHSSVGPARLRGLTLAAAAFALMVGALWLIAARPSPKALAFNVEGAEISNPNYVVAKGDAPAQMKFTDGSSVELAPTARLRVQQVTADGATVVLERGRALANVVHRSTTHWKVLAGPFEITVVGTRFQTDWDPASESLTVDLYQGSLQIDGQRSGESAVLQKGQRFRAVGRTTHWSISPIDDANDVVSSTPAAPDVSRPKAASAAVVAPGTPAAAPAKVAAVTPARAPQQDWAGAMSKGDFSRVVSEAEARGIASCLDQCSIAEVRYLADAARYTRRFELAEQALGTLRRRAPGEAPAAAYLLGALNESQGRSMAALRWYEQCVAEAPTGRVVSEAQAGRLRMLMATNQLEAARAAARQYLVDYPRGVGVTTAHKLLEAR
jgi:ferric-dicitrate binding protein FerR (iron transport regulator)